MFGMKARHEGDGWMVYLPHQCDSWSIAGDHGDPVGLDEAVASLEAFIAEAQQVLEQLQAGRETPVAE